MEAHRQLGCNLGRRRLDQPDFGVLLPYLALPQSDAVVSTGHVLNYLSLNERLPTVFKPVSPPPYLNGGPAEFLSWVIECSDDSFTPSRATEWLAGRLPKPD